MTIGKRTILTAGALLLGALLGTSALGQVATRFVVPGGAATLVKRTPGQSFAFEARLDAPATQTIGAAFRPTQSGPATSPTVFAILGRYFTGSIYSDTASGTAELVVIAAASSRLDPDNDDNLGRSTLALAATAAGNNLLIEKVTLGIDAAAPLGTYTIKPVAADLSAVTDAAFNDYDMAKTAAFTVIVGQTLTVVVASSGAGAVTSSVGAINCPVSCSDIFPGSTVTLIVTPNADSVFTGWSGGGCTGTGPCVVTVSAATTVTATFQLRQSLTVNLAGTGIGSVTSSPAGINCPSTCSTPFVPGVPVTLTAVPLPGSTFSGWSGGGCSGTGICVLTFVSPSALPLPGLSQGGWGGGCTAGGGCSFALQGPGNVTATFTYTGSTASFDYLQKAYVAYYGRPADPAGQAYWSGQMDLAGGSLAAIIDAFGNSAEFNSRYGGLSYSALVTKIYQQALNRDPDPAGLAYYVGELQAGRRTLQSITLDVLNGATTPPDSTVVANKLTVAAYYTSKVAAGCAYGSEQDGLNALAAVTADVATVAAAKAAIDLGCGP
jgi:hypothetical protein